MCKQKNIPVGWILIVRASVSTRCQYWWGCPQLIKFEHVSGDDHQTTKSLYSEVQCPGGAGAEGDPCTVRSNAMILILGCRHFHPHTTTHVKLFHCFLLDIFPFNIKNRCYKEALKTGKYIYKQGTIETEITWECYLSIDVTDTANVLTAIYQLVE